jgi:hypothetical protein
VWARRPKEASARRRAIEEADTASSLQCTSVRGRMSAASEGRREARVAARLRPTRQTPAMHIVT